MLRKLSEYIYKLLNIPELIFFVVALIFGIMFLIYTPPGCVPDEPAHAYRACDVAVGHFSSFSRSDYRPYDDIISGALSERFKHDNLHFAMRYSPLMYLASALGIKIGSYISNDDLFIFNCGRFFNLLQYLILIFLAIRITPVFKYPFMFVSLLPMSLFLASSYSADSFVISFSFFVFAYLFKLLFSKCNIERKQINFLAIISVLGSLAKGLIYPAFLYVFIPIKEHKLKILFFIFFITIISFIFATLKLNYINVNPISNVLNDKLYIFHNFESVLNSIFITTKELGYIYIRQMIGVLGWLSIPIPESVCNRVILVFFLMLMVLYENIKLNIKILSGVIFIFLYLMILYLELVTWTPIGKTIIEGVQGRYFLPFLPFIMLAMPSFKLNLSENWKCFFKIFIMFFVINVLCVSLHCMHVYYYELNIKNFI